MQELRNPSNPSNPLNINFFAGPGVGKSTIAAELFSVLKRQHKNVELITEYAKEVTYRGDNNTLKDQLYLLGKQHNKLFRLLHHNVDILIHDSPFIMGINYAQDDGYLPIDKFKELALQLFNNYNNINIFLQRNPQVKYQQLGRNQSLQEAIEMDVKIQNFLNTNDIPFKIINVDTDCLNNIIKYIEEKDNDWISI